MLSINSFISLLIGIIFGGLGFLGIHEITPAPATPPQTATVYPVEQPVPDPAPDHFNISVGATNANSVETTVALFETTLANGITANATTMTLTSATTKDGTTLASSTYAFIIDEGTASQEFVRADCTGTTCTNMERGISVLTGTTSVTALMKKHNRGVSVKITTGPSLIELTNLINGLQVLRNPLITSVSSSSVTRGGQLVMKDYVDFVGTSGCANAGEATRGCTELATQLEMGSSSVTGSTGAGLVLQSIYATSSPSVVCGVCTVVTQVNGRIAPSFFSTVNTYAFGGVIANASSTFSATTTIAGTLQVGTSTNFTQFKGVFGGNVNISGGLSVGVASTSPAAGTIISTLASTTRLVVSGSCTGCSGATTTVGTAALQTGNTNTTNANATCPTGMISTGGGFSGLSSTGYIPYASQPNASPPTDSTGWSVTVVCNSVGLGTCVAGTLTVYALCVNK